MEETYAETSFPAMRAILILQRAHDFVVASLAQRKLAGEVVVGGGPGRHRNAAPRLVVENKLSSSCVKLREAV